MFPSEASNLCNAARVRSNVCSLQGRDDVDEVIPFAFIHFDLPCPSVRSCFGDHSICLSKFTLVCIDKADISAEVSAVQTGIRMRTWACDDGYRTVAVCERLSENVSREPLEIASVERSLSCKVFPVTSTKVPWRYSASFSFMVASWMCA